MESKAHIPSEMTVEKTSHASGDGSPQSVPISAPPQGFESYSFIQTLMKDQLERTSDQLQKTQETLQTERSQNAVTLATKAEEHRSEIEKLSRDLWEQKMEAWMLKKSNVLELKTLELEADLERRNPDASGWGKFWEWLDRNGPSLLDKLVAQNQAGAPGKQLPYSPPTSNENEVPDNPDKTETQAQPSDSAPAAFMQEVWDELSSAVTLEGSGKPAPDEQIADVAQHLKTGFDALATKPKMEAWKGLLVHVLEYAQSQKVAAPATARLLIPILTVVGDAGSFLSAPTALIVPFILAGASDETRDYASTVIDQIRGEWHGSD